MLDHRSDREDDPRSAGPETRRLALDEYERPRYGAPPRYARRWESGAPGARMHVVAAHEADRSRVHELMSRRVSTVHPATPLARAARIMAEGDCGALPVIGDNGALVGVVTDRDMAVRVVARGLDVRTAIVADCMTARVFACYANEAVAECMRQMARHRVRRMPIVDERGRLVGIVSQGDLARHIGRQGSAEERWALTEVLRAVSQR